MYSVQKQIISGLVENVLLNRIFLFVKKTDYNLTVRLICRIAGALLVHKISWPQSLFDKPHLSSCQPLTTSCQFIDSSCQL
jgi:hypothetical protein